MWFLWVTMNFQNTTTRDKITMWSRALKNKWKCNGNDDDKKNKEILSIQSK